jgi:Na+/proline symporter
MNLQYCLINEPFPYCLCTTAGVMAITAGLAAIMSTADSLLIAISQLITVEIVYPMRPNSTPNNIAWFARLISTISVALSLLIG